MSHPAGHHGHDRVPSTDPSVHTDPSATTDPRVQEIGRRLRSVEGHVRGIERMVESDAYCMDILNQVLAVQRALGKVSALVLDRHLHTCATSAIRGEDVEERERVLGELLQIFQATGKL